MRFLLTCSIALSLCLNSLAQNIRYQFSAPNAIHHEAEIIIVADGLPLTPAIFKMSRSSPGRYAKHEFGKNIYNVAAFDGAGKSLQVQKEDADVYKLSGHKGTIKLTYTLFGNYADGTYASIDVTGYHLNMPASFMWIKGMEKAPVTIQFAADKNWKVATQLKPTSDPYTFTAPNLQYFMDAPTKVAGQHFRDWSVTNPDQKKYNFRLALDAEGSEQLVDSFTEKLKRIVEAAKAVYGEVPAFDYGMYTFIAGINPFVRGDGMEHRNSTMITIPREFTGTNGSLGVFAHEFFHCWNVERIRPKSLEPFNFEKSNMSEALWVAEGFTQYYGQLLMMRAGMSTNEDFLDGMSQLVNTKINTPGARLHTPIENSERAVFVDAGVSIDQTNYPNMFSSYYTYGGALALALDLDVRAQFNKSLDEVMRVLWKKHGKTEVPYTIPDVQKALAIATGDESYAADFFRKYVYGHEAPDYQKLFSAANLSIAPANGGKAWFGRVNFRPTDQGLTVAGNTVRNTPLYNAGIDVNDIILTLNEQPVKTADNVNSILNGHKPGDRLSVTYVHRNKTIKTEIDLKEDPWVTILPAELESGKITEKQQQFREAWMGKTQ